MNVQDDTLVIVRGVNDDYFKENFSQLCLSFGGSPQAIPKEDAYYVGIYLGAPSSAITYIGIVKSIERYDDPSGADFYLKSIVMLEKPIKLDHAIRKHENWHLSDFGIDPVLMDRLRTSILNIRV